MKRKNRLGDIVKSVMKNPIMNGRGSPRGRSKLTRIVRSVVDYPSNRDGLLYPVLRGDVRTSLRRVGRKARFKRKKVRYNIPIQDNYSKDFPQKKTGMRSPPTPSVKRKDPKTEDLDKVHRDYRLGKDSVEPRNVVSESVYDLPNQTPPDYQKETDSTNQTSVYAAPERVPVKPSSFQQEVNRFEDLMVKYLIKAKAVPTNTFKDLSQVTSRLKNIFLGRYK